MISFSGRHYPQFIILQCVRWYVSYALSYRNIEEMMKERGFNIDHATLIREGYRRSVCGADSIYYRINGDTVEIMNILGQQNINETL